MPRNVGVLRVLPAKSNVQFRGLEYSGKPDKFHLFHESFDPLVDVVSIGENQ